ncbi:VWA domain-containing protein [Paraglaciecola sp. 20A4]|uniref:vWA domain-containing protein n=1 Tax=Paraglaciecola sp. 20A4 TaxID=2687288 RepID=UPI00140E0D8D|nr:VWA domain-containing protein [Paraglaciecola sp. 20A4]
MIDFNISDFHFIRPLWLLVLIPLLLLIVFLRRIHHQRSGWQSVLPNHLYQHLVTQNGVKSSKPPLYLLTIAWILTSLALAGPTWQRLPQPVYQLNSGKVVVLDMSLSMRATDIKPNRLTRAKYKAIDLVKAIAEGETGLVAYAGDAFTISPLSSDGQNLTTLIPSLTPEIMPVAGSEPFLGLQSAIELLHNAGYQQGEIFWITDGIENNQVAEVSKLFASSPYRLSVLSVGTPDGAPIQLLNGDFLKDGTGAVVVPRLRASNLQTLARKGGGRYVSMRADDSDIEYLKNQTLLSTEQEKDDEADEKFGDKWQEMGPYLLLLLVPLAAYGFRRGLLGVFTLFLLFPGYTPTASANWWDDMWQTKDQQGQHAFKQGDFDTAVAQFGDPMWRGAAAYKAQDYETALDAFKQADGAQARYNEGNALAQLGKIDDAIKAYKEALTIDPHHQDALANKAILEKQKQQQEQQKDDQKEGSEQSKDQDKSEQDDEPNGEQNSSQDQQGNPQQQDNQDSEQDQSQNNENQEDQSQSESSSAQDQPPPNKDEDKDEASDTDEEQEASPEQQDANQDETEQNQAAQTSGADSMENETEAQQEQQQATPIGEKAPEELTDEQKEQMQRMQTLLNRVPDDPAFLLKRKMQIENQQRRQQRTPTQRQRNW